MENCNQLAQQGNIQRIRIHLYHLFISKTFFLISLFFDALKFAVYHTTDESDCADFEEWISDDTIRKRLNIWISTKYYDIILIYGK